MVQDLAEALMGAEADALCGAGYGERSPERVNIRNGSSFPDWLLAPRRRAEQAFVSVIADAYLVSVSTRRVEKLVRQLGVERMLKGIAHRQGRGAFRTVPRRLA